MQADCPVQLKLIGCIRGGIHLERMLFEILKKHRSHSKWLNPSDRLDQFIAKCLESDGVRPEIVTKQGSLYRPKSAREFLEVNDGLK